MKIAAVHAAVIDHAMDDSRAEPDARHALISVTTADGVAGVGRCWAAQVPYVNEHLGPILVGEDARDVERLWQRMWGILTSLRGTRHELDAIWAIGAVDVALWDLCGRILGVPCWRLLGGFRSSVSAYADVPNSWSTIDQLCEQVCHHVAQGFRIVKIHCGRADAPDAVAATRAVRDAVGPEIGLALDLYHAFDVGTSIEIAHGVRDCRLLWLEDPGPWNDAGEGLARVARHTDIPVAAGENLTSLYACRDMINAGGIRLLTPDLFGCGGFTGVRKMAILSEAAHIGVMLHGANFPELAAHVVSGVPNGYLVAAMPPSHAPEIWSRLYEDFALRGDRIELSERPGLGLTLDSAYLDPTVVST